MKYTRTIQLVIFLAIAVVACQPGGPATPPQQPALQDDSLGTLPEESSTQASVPTFPPQEANMTPVTPPNETADKMVTLVKQHLAQKLSIAVDQIMLSAVKPVVWRDAGLGCPKPGVDYIQMETPGYNILLEAGGKTYTYHTDETKRFVQCNK
jgi:hypothetical protein